MVCYSREGAQPHLVSCVIVCVFLRVALFGGRPAPRLGAQSIERPREGTFRPMARNMTLRAHSEKERSMLAACFLRMRSSSSLTEMDMARRLALCSATRR